MGLESGSFLEEVVPGIYEISGRQK